MAGDLLKKCLQYNKVMDAVSLPSIPLRLYGRVALTVGRLNVLLYWFVVML